MQEAVKPFIRSVYISAVAVYLLFQQYPLQCQDAYIHLSHRNIYSFLDELANLQVIELNAAAKPYSRQLIAGKLNNALEKKDRLNPRQINEIEFYLRDFNKELQSDRNFSKRIDLLYREDSLFTFSFNPILGIRYWVNKNGTVYHRWNGAEAFAYVGDHWGFYASLRDNHESMLLNNPSWLTDRFGAPYKSGSDFSEMRGGITYSWKWGSIGLVKDHLQWGSGYNGSNILTGRTPSFAMLKLEMQPAEWFEFNYFHGWLVSEVIDSSRTWYYTNVNRTFVRLSYREKYMAANLFTLKPLRGLYVSFGNSIVYSDTGIEPAYLIPLFFFKSVDHSINKSIDNQNSQMFFDISSRQIKHLHLYTSLFVDEVAIGRMFNPDRHSNFFSWKLGGSLTGYPLNNLSATAELTRTNPLVYKHYLPTVTFESNRYNLGHYLQDNASELYFALDYIPARGVRVKLSYLHARKGPDYTSLTTERIGLPYMENIEWENRSLAFETSWQVINDGYLFLSFLHGRTTGDVEKYSPGFFHGTTNTLSFGANFGF